MTIEQQAIIDGRQTMKPSQMAMIDEVVDELRPAVTRIEARLATTRDHYGDYMGILGQYPRAERLTIAVLLIKAGANQAGVRWALRLS